ncbi:NUDIX domain-containing protein [Rhodococcus sp. X156]|uniref:(deoxy)nucleoside triphosphate pyrophosphohydrolase n=1 Tax=Rhodococcus sp. X156 TaxID=2499145 RepID=UPI000FD96401|nr:NUDIX domain-containing protein [Rhodococcus sp. X156]
MAAAREVVAGAVVADGRLLVAQRRRPPALAGKWELAGGGVEPGESPQQALVRELDEELGVVVEPGEQVGADVLLPDGRVLRAYRAELVRGPAEAREHAALRWVGAGELSRLDLVVNDRGWRAELAPLLVE